MKLEEDTNASVTSIAPILRFLEKPSVISIWILALARHPSQVPNLRLNPIGGISTAS